MGIEQLDQHFIFNALNTISNVVEKDPAAGKELLLDFSDYLREIFSLAGGQGFTTVEREIGLVSGYLNLQKARFSERLDFSVSVSEHGLCRIPSGSIFGKLEERIKGAMKEKNKRIDLRLEVIVDPEWVRIELVENDEKFCWEIEVFQEA